MAKNKLSIKDIASQLNVSITTVSFILNGKAKENRISDKLTKKVLKHVEEVGYKPNQLAQSLRTGKSKILVFMVEDISNSFFSGVAKIMENKALENGYKIIYCSTDNKLDKSRELIELFKNRHVDGYIITPVAGIEQDLMELVEEGIPLVLFDRFFPGLNISHVVINNEQGTHNAISHLIENGFSNIGFITLISDETQMVGRLNGYISAVEKHALPQSVLKVQFNDLRSDIVVTAIKEFILKNPIIDALFFATNHIAISGLEAIKELDMKIPEDIAVISFDDGVLFRLYEPPITVLAQPIEDLSNELMKSILSQLNGNLGVEQIELPVKFLSRASSRALKISK